MDLDFAHEIQRLSIAAKTANSERDSFKRQLEAAKVEAGNSRSKLDESEASVFKLVHTLHKREVENRAREEEIQALKTALEIETRQVGHHAASGQGRSLPAHYSVHLTLENLVCSMFL
jgi:hypothetical protein